MNYKIVKHDKDFSVLRETVAEEILNEKLSSEYNKLKIQKLQQLLN